MELRNVGRVMDCDVEGGKKDVISEVEEGRPEALR
jgi:hypothetical protein